MKKNKVPNIVLECCPSDVSGKVHLRILLPKYSYIKTYMYCICTVHIAFPYFLKKSINVYYYYYYFWFIKAIFNCVYSMYCIYIGSVVSGCVVIACSLQSTVLGQA